MNGYRHFGSKLKEFITKDTTVANESTKVAIVIRVLLISVFVYFLADMAACWSIFDGQGRLLSVMFCVVIVALFAMSYSLRAKTAAWVFSFGMLAFIWFNLVWFGWSIGVQHYLIVILLLIFFVGYEGYRGKMILATIACGIRIGFYFRFHASPSAYTIPAQRQDLLQIINTVAIFWCLGVICYVFSKNSRELESKLVKYNEKLEKEALTDNLTGLANRRRAMDYIQQLMHEKTHDNFSLCMCDIDFFKRVNDTWGHDTGDVVLKQIAAIFRENMKGGCMPCRWGGEEFLLLFPGLNGDEAYEVLLRIRDKIKAMVVRHEDSEIRVTMTFGLSEFDYSHGMDDAIQEADGKLYYGKNHGRDQIVF